MISVKLMISKLQISVENVFGIKLVSSSFLMFCFMMMVQIMRMVEGGIKDVRVFFVVIMFVVKCLLQLIFNIFGIVIWVKIVDVVIDVLEIVVKFVVVKMVEIVNFFGIYVNYCFVVLNSVFVSFV